MKKTPIPLILAGLVIIGSLLGHPSTATAREEYEKLNLWANDLGREPGDPSYLTLHYRLRELYFAVDPHPAHPVVLLGDSITYGGDWPRLFPHSPVENMGIGGDTTAGLLNRLNQVIVRNPSQIFLMIGTNDLCFDRPIPDILRNYRRILGRFHKDLPDTAVYVESVIPFNNTLFPSADLRTNGNIRKLDSGLRQVAAQYHYPFINLVPDFTGIDGRLPVKYTTDGLHLNSAGYLVWRDRIKSYVKVTDNG